MDTDDVIVLTLGTWVVICMILVKTVDVFVTLLLIGLLVVMEVCGNYIRPEAKQKLKATMYFLLFVFFIIVVKKVMDVLS